MKNKVAVILFAVLFCTLLVSIVINIITVRKCGSSRIMDVYDIGLGGLMNSEVEAMYIDEGNNPALQGEFFDKSVVEDIREVLFDGCFQEASAPVIDSAPGSGTCPFIRLKTADTTYVLAVKGDVISVTIDGKNQCYYTNIRHRIGQIISDAVKTVEFQG